MGRGLNRNVEWARMKRFFHILLGGATALSALLCVAALALWVRGYWVGDEVYHSRWWRSGPVVRESACWLFAGRGRVGVGHRWQAIRYDPDGHSFDWLFN